MYLVTGHARTILLFLLILVCGCQTEAEWFKNSRGPIVEPIKVYSYDDELRDEQLKYDDTGIWLVDYLKLTNYILN
jgi:hypothetical protein